MNFSSLYDIGNIIVTRQLVNRQFLGGIVSEIRFAKDSEPGYMVTGEPHYVFKESQVELIGWHENLIEYVPNNPIPIDSTMQEYDLEFVAILSDLDVHGYSYHPSKFLFLVRHGFFVGPSSVQRFIWDMVVTKDAKFAEAVRSLRATPKVK